MDKGAMHWNTNIPHTKITKRNSEMKDLWGNLGSWPFFLHGKFTTIQNKTKLHINIFSWGILTINKEDYFQTDLTWPYKFRYIMTWSTVIKGVTITVTKGQGASSSNKLCILMIPQKHPSFKVPVLKYLTNNVVVVVVKLTDNITFPINITIQVESN